MSYRVPSHVYHRELHGEVVLLDTRADAYLGLNRTAAAAWEVLAAAGAPATAVEALIAQFEVDAETARQDIEALLSDLLARGLLEPDTALPKASLSTG